MLFIVKIFTGVTKSPEEKINVFFWYVDFSGCFIAISNPNKAWPSVKSTGQTFLDS